MVGESISHYKVLRKVGGGGMGVVFEAEDVDDLKISEGPKELEVAKSGEDWQLKKPIETKADNSETARFGHRRDGGRQETVVCARFISKHPHNLSRIIDAPGLRR